MSGFIFYSHQLVPINIFTFLAVTIIGFIIYLITLYLSDKFFRFKVTDTLIELLQSRFGHFSLFNKLLKHHG